MERARTAELLGARGQVCGLMQNCEKLRLLLCKVKGRLDRKLQRASEFTREPENYTEAQDPTLVVLVALGGGGEGS